MQQHPIPQNVTQYQFRLVGDMTLKQFLELAGGLLVAYLFYASNLIFIFKWPLALFSVFVGLALAFFPLEDRPLDQWAINFIKVIYGPTRFIWQKTNKIPSLFLFTAHPPDVVNTVTKTIKAPVLNTAANTPSDLSADEAKQIEAVDSLFTTLPPPPVSPTTIHDLRSTTLPDKPSVTIRKLKPQEATATPPVFAHPNKTVSIPSLDPTKIDHQPIASSVTPQTPTTNVVFQAPYAPTSSAPTNLGTAKNITLPASPKLPNLVTGVVVDTSGKLVENAIVQIISRDGIPARAMKTGSLGQFYTSTPLSPDTYVIEIDKDGLRFSPQQIVINNTILPPIELRATI
jgi:hypothetical protein